MCRWRRSTRRTHVDQKGFSTTELLVGTLLTTLAVTATSGFFLASTQRIRFQLDGMETSQAARSVADLIVRDLRLSGACLPDTGRFIALEGADGGEQDEIIIRTGLVQPASCVRTSLQQSVAIGTGTLYVEHVDGFLPGMRVYLRDATGDGEFAEISGVNSSDSALTLDGTLTNNYPKTSGVYAVRERRFYVAEESTPLGVSPQLMMQVDVGEPTPFATGIEKFDLTYQLGRNCPPCDTLDLPNGEAEWSLVEQVFVTVTARSDETDSEGEHHRTTISVSAKPRNLRPRSGG